ncbi:unnamed protein product [Phaedon cochleariae]|uniref:Uncharacterized protein n=1 Tax=Phaedon cochleariae TaxID=80249 RepID=A0A9N9X5Y8_PHACE|nr:unnamed protein product [Phaedon cochleariae]
MCFYAKQKYVAAISCLKRALWVQPLNWRTLFNLGLAHLATLQPASAFNFACAAVNLRSDVADCFAVLGASLIELKDPENAARAFHQALLLSPEDLHLILNASVCCLTAGMNNQAVDLLRKFNALIENGATCTDELSDLASRVSIELERIQPLDNQMEILADPHSSNLSNQTRMDDQEQVDMLKTSREIIEREMEPDEV